MKNIMVSISCLTYNQEKFVADALDSFIMQKVDFDYEILIHDDASTDKTADIIRTYEEKYPDLINVIYQSENTYSKGAKICEVNQIRARGKYIAICEGDDYWTDPYKLQKQVAYMESHPECSLCVHAGYMVNENKELQKKHVRPSIGDREFSIHEIISSGGKLFVTNSVLYRTDLVLTRPRFFELSPVGDYPLMILLALQGSVYYMDTYMSAYRVGIEGSWSERTYSNPEKTIRHFERTLEMLEELNQYSNHQYVEAIDIRKNQILFNLNLVQNKFEELKSSKFKPYYSQLSLFEKLSILIRQHFPGVYKKLKQLKGA
jgi:glycosyltransferase involved in cell wall biosynthesis